MIVCLRQFVESEGSYDIDDLTCLGTKYQQCKFTRTLRCYSLCCYECSLGAMVLLPCAEKCYLIDTSNRFLDVVFSNTQTLESLPCPPSKPQLN